MMIRKQWIILACIFFFIIFIPACSMVKGYNRLVHLDERVSSSWSQVENVLQRRYDLIPNLVNIVKGYAKHEKDALTEVTRLRSQWGNSKSNSVDGRLKSAQGLESALGRLMVIAERYPDLKANQNFIRLQDELTGTENRISVERRRYNQTIQSYNVIVRRFPTNILSSVWNFDRKKKYFEANKESTVAPKIEF